MPLAPGTRERKIHKQLDCFFLQKDRCFKSHCLQISSLILQTSNDLVKLIIMSKNLEKFFCNNRGEIGFQKLQNFLSRCQKGLYTFQKVFNASGSNSLGQLPVLYTFKIQKAYFFVAPALVRSGYGNAEGNVD